MSEKLDLKRLHDPFEPDAIEWRVQQSGKKGDKVWAKVLCYVTNRAIMDRLDEVCQPQYWKNEYREAPQGGVICGISIKMPNDEWVTKWDGAENTDIEGVKGGLSGAMKRAAVQWGIGRYLYRLDAGFAKVHPGGKFKSFDKKTNTSFRWDPPPLPKWALPDKQSKPVEQFEPLENPDFETEPEPKPKPVKTWADLPKSKQQSIAIRRKELADSIEWGPKYSGYDEWIESAGILGLKQDGKPSFAVSTVDQINRAMAFLEKLAVDRPKQTEQPKDSLPVSEATRQAATANGVQDPTKFDANPLAGLDGPQLVRKLVSIVKAKDVQLGTIVNDALGKREDGSIRLHFPVGYDWHFNESTKSIDLLEECAGLPVFVTIGTPEQVSA